MGGMPFFGAGAVETLSFVSRVSLQTRIGELEKNIATEQENKEKVSSIIIASVRPP